MSPENTKRGTGEASSIITFLSSLLVGALGIHAGAIFILGSSSFTTAIIAAFVGALVWGIASFFSGWIPLLGTIITFVVWLGAINMLYGAGWVAALQIAVLAWIVSILVLWVLSAIGLTDTKALGVPGA